MLEYVISLIGSYFSSGIARIYLFPMIALGFIYCFPSIVSSFVKWR